MASLTAGTTFTDGVANDVTAAKLGALVTNATPTSGFIQDRTAETVVAVNDTLLIGDASDSNNLKRMTVANLLKAPLVSTSGTIDVLTTGTTTSTAEIITSGTIATLNSTTGTITNLSATTPTFLGAITGSTNVINIGGGQIYKDSSGNVGIGTTSPSQLLTVGSPETPVISGAKVGVYSSGASLIIIRDTTNDIETLIGTVTGTLNSVVGSATNHGLEFRTNNTERLRIDSSGNVGIGTASPSSNLHVVKSISQTDIDNATQAVSIVNTASDTSGNLTGIRLRQDNGTNVAQGYIGLSSTGNSATRANLIIATPSTSGNSTERLRIDSSGGVTIAGLAGSGSRAVNASAAGLLSAASDASLKEEVVGAHIAGLDEILQIHPKMYKWKDDVANRGDEASVELGFIANDVAPIIPSAAPIGNDGLYGFYDRSITAALVKSVQELKAENDSLKARIEALEAK